MSNYLSRSACTTLLCEDRRRLGIKNKSSIYFVLRSACTIFAIRIVYITKKVMRRIFIIAILAGAMLTSCQESMEQRALRETQEYTAKHCPERLNDTSILDSITFDVATHTLTENLTLTGEADSPEKIESRLDELRSIMIEAVRNNTRYKRMKEAGYSFRYIARSARNKDIVLYDQTVTKEDY